MNLINYHLLNLNQKQERALSWALGLLPDTSKDNDVLTKKVGFMDEETNSPITFEVVFKSVPKGYLLLNIHQLP